MAQRTSTAAVQAILGQDYDTNRSPSLQPRIDTATLIVDRVITCATSKGYTISTTEAEMMERWLAAHYYTKSDPTYQSRSTSSASGSFVRNPQCPEPYKDAALTLDPSGCLSAILKGNQSATAIWLGRTVPERSTWEERN